MLVVASPAIAYFQVPQDLAADGFTLPPTRSSAELDSSRLALYPDFKALAGQKKTPSLYYGLSSPQLSPVQHIDLNPLVIGTTSLATSTLELSLKNLLYADFKLRKLYEEYKGVQARARELIGHDSFTDSGSGQGKTGHSPSDISHWASKQTVHEHKKTLERWQRNEARRIITLTRSSETHVKIRDSILGSLMSLRETIEEKSFSLRDIVVQKSQASNDGAASGPVSLTEHHNVRIRIDPYGQGGELPWIFRKILAGLGFVFAHKVEASVIGMSLFALFGVLISLRKV